MGGNGNRGADAFDRPEVFLTLGRSLVEQQKGAAVEELIADTLSSHPDDPVYDRIARTIRTHKVPGWHGSMLGDAPRNAAYRAAIAAAAPGRVVLDIGTGSGLLAMIAARAGAERVVACEANPVVAEAARRVVAANGLDHVVTIHACHSSKLERSAIADAGADLVVSEIFAADLVGEGVLGALDHARAELAAPGALFVPEAAGLRVALAQLDTVPPAPLAAEGFDLGAFAPLYRKSGFVWHSQAGLTLSSAPADLARFDWNAPEPPAVTGRAEAEVVAEGGPANVVVQWLRITFGEGIVYENAPYSGASDHWGVTYHELPAPILTQAGERHPVGAFWHGDTLALWAG